MHYTEAIEKLSVFRLYSKKTYCHVIDQKMKLGLIWIN